MIEATPAPCPVHPATYHDQPQVLPQGSSRIFRFESAVGLPRRCSLLETELMEADRELELIERLRVLERGGNGSHVITAVLSACLGLGVGLMANGDALDGDSARPFISAVAIASAFALCIEWARARVVKARLDRILDWRKRLGN